MNTEEDTNARDRFVEMAVNVIGESYDEIDRKFATNIADIDARGSDTFGYFTIGKEVWVARRSSSSQIIGFEVITRKRGGSIKLGPTLLSNQFHGQGYATEIVETLLTHYSAAGARKVYVTAPLNNVATAALDLRSLGLSVEAILRGHYREGYAERVFGRLLRNSQTRGIPARVGIEPAGSSIDVTSGMGSLNPEEFRLFILDSMKDSYKDIDDSFVQAICSAHKRGINSSYEEKGKITYSFWIRNQFIGVAICTPKRGGSVKVGPLIVKPGFVSQQTLKTVVRELCRNIKLIGKRKLFFVLPTVDWNVISVLFDIGLVMEGIIREPYKEGVDFVIVSEFVDHVRGWK